MSWSSEVHPGSAPAEVPEGWRDCPWAGSSHQVRSGRLKPLPAKTDRDPSALSHSQKGRNPEVNGPPACLILRNKKGKSVFESVRRGNLWDERSHLHPEADQGMSSIGQTKSLSSCGEGLVVKAIGAHRGQPSSSSGGGPNAFASQEQSASGHCEKEKPRSTTSVICSCNTPLSNHPPLTFVSSSQQEQ